MDTASAPGSALFGDLIKGLWSCLSRLEVFVCSLAAAVARVPNGNQNMFLSLLLDFQSPKEIRLALMIFSLPVFDWNSFFYGSSPGTGIIVFISAVFTLIELCLRGASVRSELDQVLKVFTRWGRLNGNLTLWQGAHKHLRSGLSFSRQLYRRGTDHMLICEMSQPQSIRLRPVFI